MLMVYNWITNWNWGIFNFINVVILIEKDKRI